MIREAGAREGPGDGRFDPSPPRDLEARPRALPTIDRRRSLGQIASVVVPYLAVWALAALVQPAPWLAVVLGVAGAAILMRMYSLFHDLTHNSLFRSRAANRRWGYLLGFLLCTPYRWWQRQHSLHHANTGNLDKRGPGEIDTMTVAEYASASRLRRLGLPRSTATRC